MASPHVNGVVALMRQANDKATVQDLKQAIYDTAFDLGSSGEDNSYGWGMIDAFEAVQSISNFAGIIFEFPNGRPAFIDPAGGTTIRVEVLGTSGVPQPGTGKLYYSVGDGFTVVDMEIVADNVYDAVFPSFDCGVRVDYYFSAENTDGQAAFNPPGAPDGFYSGDAYTGRQVIFSEDFENDNGWTVVNENLDDGPWERAIPAGGGDRGDPAADADGSGNCYVTDNADGNSDVDGGPTRLISPTLDATGLADPSIRYFRWFTNDDQDIDRLDIEISNNDGASWTLVESVAGGGGWVDTSFRIEDFVPPTNQMKLRFSATDNPNDSVTEAGLDGVEIFAFYCDDPVCVEDLDDSGAVDFGDVLEILAAWGNAGGREDLDGSGIVDLGDILQVLANWGPC